MEHTGTLYLVPVHGIAHLVLLVTVLVRSCDDGCGLLSRTANVGILVAAGCIVDRLVFRRVEPDITGIEGLQRRQRCIRKKSMTRSKMNVQPTAPTVKPGRNHLIPAPQTYRFQGQSGQHTFRPSVQALDDFHQSTCIGRDVGLANMTIRHPQRYLRLWKRLREHHSHFGWPQCRRRRNRKCMATGEHCRQYRAIGHGMEATGARTVPSKVAPYPARPRLPMVQTAGQRPTILFAPGRMTEVSMYPPVKQNLFL